jgi:hypothetical protein
VVVHTCNPATGRLEDHEFEASLAEKGRRRERGRGRGKGREAKKEGVRGR